MFETKVIGQTPSSLERYLVFPTADCDNFIINLNDKMVADFLCFRQQ